MNFGMEMRRNGKFGDLMTQLFAESFRNKRVLITGHTGFKGAWLALWLTELGAKVIGYALRPPTVPNLFDVIHLDKRVESIIGDVRDLKSLCAVMKRYQPQIVFHLAAQSLVRRSYVRPVETYETNLIGSINVLEACRGVVPLRAIVVVTSDKCYENRELIRGYREEDPLGGYDPYSSSKACTELIAGAYLKSFWNAEKNKRHGICLATVRAGNVIGGGDWAEDRLVPDCIKAFSKIKSVQIRYPEAVRPWQYVLEPLYGYLLLAERLFLGAFELNGPWNFGPDRSSAKPVRCIVEKISKLWGSTPALKIKKGNYLHESRYLRLSCSKAKSQLGWRPVWRLGRALEKTVYWYKRFYAKDNMENLSVRQIAEFSECVQKKRLWIGDGDIGKG